MKITRQHIQNNPDVIFLFGDNLLQKGLGGQAKEMRGEPNTIGIPTKKKPSMAKDSFFMDSEYDMNIKFIDEAFAKIPKGGIVVYPPLIGTGRAQLPTKAPKTYQYLYRRLQEVVEKSFDEADKLYENCMVMFERFVDYTFTFKGTSNRGDKIICTLGGTPDSIDNLTVLTSQVLVISVGYWSTFTVLRDGMPIFDYHRR